MKRPRVNVATDNGQAAAAAAAQAQANQAIADAQTASNNIRKNLQADLSTQNMATVIAGGTAEAVAPIGDGTRNRKRNSGLSSALGINL